MLSGFQSKVYMKTIGGEVNFEEFIKTSSARFKRAENTIPAKDYWEGFFAANPNLRPKHLIYYDGDPTTAIYRFQEQNGIGNGDTSQIDGELLGFEDHHITDMGNDPRANRGYGELVAMGTKIIAEHYAHRI